MAKFKITVEDTTEYPEMQTAYEADDGKRYFSTYQIPKDVKYKEKEYPTGAILKKSREVYVQDFVANDLNDIIKAVNGIK